MKRDGNCRWTAGVKEREIHYITIINGVANVVGGKEERIGEREKSVWRGNAN